LNSCYLKVLRAFLRKGSPFELPFYEPERIVDFIEKINCKLDDMIDHLGDCKL